MDSRGEPGEAIAIAGIACQFPGARDPAELHHLTMAGSQMFQPVPGLHTVAGHAIAGPATAPVRAALVDGWAVQFGEVPDPGTVHKLATETAAQALSDAGLPSAGRRTGLIIASTVPDLGEVARDGFRIRQECRFPAIAYQDSLHAIAASCDILRTGQLDLVIAGGAELGVDPGWLSRIAAAGELAADDVRVYDAEPTGLLPGDGCGVVVLMRSADARAAGLPVYAEITGWSAGQQADGAYAQAGIDPGDIGLIEGHGAGTASGDLAELTELARLRHGSTATAALGAVTANIGQTRSAAGVASLIKVVVAMVAGAIPPATGCVLPHELIASGAARLRLPAVAEPWPEGVRLAAVNSLGPQGQAADGVHLVLRREIDHGRGRGRRRRSALPLPPSRPAAPGRHSASSTTNDSADTAPTVLSIPAPTPPEPRHAAAVPVTTERAMPATIFALCGAEPAAVAATLDVIAASADKLAHADLHDLARQLAAAAQRAAGRGAPLRVTVTATGPRQLSGQARRAAQLLRNRDTGTPAATMLTKPGINISAGATGTIILVFPGLAATVAEHTTLLTASLNGVRLLDRLGVAADSAVGYGFGEVAGLVWAGCLPAAEAARLAALRGQVLRACLARPAALVRIGCDGARASRLCAASGVQIAVHETPGSYLLAGPSNSIRDLLVRASALGIPATLLAGPAQHWTATARCTAPLRGVLADIVFGTPRTRLVSGITGLPVTPADDIAELLASQPARPVLFAQALAMAAQRPGRPAADLIVVAGPDADPASPVTPAGAHAPAASDASQPPTTLASIATAACGLPAITLPAIALPPATLAPAIASLFTAGAIRDLAPYLIAPRTDPGQAPWTVPPMRDAGPAETGLSTSVSSRVSRGSLVGELPRQLPVGPQRHAGVSVRVQFDPQHLVELDLVLIEAEP
jgi:enediyne polyketide synthase